MNSSEQTRSFIEDLFGSISQEGFSDRFKDALHDNLKWTATGSSPVGGVYTSKEDYLNRCLSPLFARLATPVNATVERILVDNEWATVLFRSEGVTGKNGADFSMSYCWIIRVVDKRIVEVVGFYDQKKVWDVFA
ncbi:MAG: hypothetical protein M1820_007017 [Bogoriella megaspora]|nr:MAG: hypothetical protein M1820_007017 [Bogoriella megaspora]